MKKKYFTEEEKRNARNKSSKKYRKTIKEYDKTHKHEQKIYQKEYRKNNREELKIKSKKYYKIHKKHKEYYQIHKEERKRQAKCYRESHKKERNIKTKNRLKTDINFKLSYILRKRVCNAIYNNQKAGSAVRDLGCSIPELKLYLEARFKPGMTWDNWSRTAWHIDHIIPLDSFNLSNREEFLQACHYTNLQPLWAEENLIKSNKRRENDSE